MPPITLSHLCSELRARAVDVAGTLYGRTLILLPRAVLLTLERYGFPGVGWALLACDLAESARERELAADRRSGR